MNSVDYIVVGAGIAGIAFCEQLRSHHRSFVVFDDNSQQSSRVAAGLYNPVVLKRFTAVWNAKAQLSMAMPKYARLEKDLGLKLNHRLPIYRRFTSIEEQNNWFSASDKPVLSEFLSTDLVKNENPSIHSDHSFGEVLHSGRINTNLMVKTYLEFLQNQNKLYEEAFDYSKLKAGEDRLSYMELTAKYIVFAEGYGLKHNPFFNHLPLNGTKGEMLTIKAPKLDMKFILKSSVFVVPLQEDLYWVGSTYEWNDKTHTTTEKAKNELLEKVKNIINCDFEVIDQVAGIRPTTKDRRPLVGMHKEHKNLFVLNGLGSRGVMMSHFVAEELFNHIEHGKDLIPEIDISRFS